MKPKLLISLLLGLIFLAGQVWAQDRVVTGTVTDDEGATLPGVTVVLKGTSTGTVTDIDGIYKVSVPGNDAILVFSFVGFTTQEVTVGAQSNMDIGLLTDVSQLEEIVVTGSAVGKSRKTLSFAVGVIDETAMTRVPAPNLSSGLQGKVAGLRVNGIGGQPGTGAFFQIRSATSISNGQRPLVIVDGVFMNGSTLADINAEDVERVEVLKGSAGASLYGSQAANGVIQIFTRRGKGLDVGDTKITYRGEWGFSKEANRYDINNFTNRTVLNPGDVGHDPNDPNPQFSNRTLGVATTEIPNLQDYQEKWLFRKGFFQTNYIAVQGRAAQT
ncbi:MAG: TonB-dependent receptor plug domain-containing protein, partial [Bacteroidetes bacterium]|nr:TonB-dependent receptor plug domain-containing protein [Bacteroidota bacterium]